MDLTYLWLFPVSILIAGIANGAGIGGATFFSPLFVIVLGLEPTVAVGAALATEVFGFASGVVAHARARAIDWRVVRMLTAVSVPAAIVGSLLAGVAPELLLKVILGVGLAVIAFTFVRHHDDRKEDAGIELGIDVVPPTIARRIVTADDTVYEYQMCRMSEGRAGAGIGGLLVGLISTGLGEANSYLLVKRCRIPSRVAVAVSVTTVAITALAASITHAIGFVANPSSDTGTILSVIVFTIPGVIIGGQLGPAIVGKIPEQRLIRSLGWLFFAVSALTLYEAFAA
jgi:uncharacterized membrane protein YfcA